MELHHYPLDFQTCPLYFGSFAYSEDDVKYTWNSGKDASVARAPDMTMSQFDLINFSAETSFTYRKDVRQSMLTVYFNLRRHTGYFVINIFVPCMLLVILSWVSFWINREATSDRIALGTTTVLTMAFLALDSRSDLPRVKYATALDLYIALCFVFILSAIVQFAIVHRFTKHGHGDVEPSPTDNDEDDEESEDETAHTRNGKPHNQSFHPDTNTPSNRVFLCRGESRLRVWLSSLRIKNRRQFKRRKHRNSVSQIDRVSRDKSARDKIIQNWQKHKTSFGENSAAHKPKSVADGINIVYLHNIPTYMTEESIHQELKHLYDIVVVNRKRYRDTGKPMPVVRVVFKNQNQAKIALASKGFCHPGTNTYSTFQPDRKFKIVRCYNCNKFGHISKWCLNQHTCANCGKENCAHSNCKATPCCINCGGIHPSTSGKYWQVHDVPRVGRKGGGVAICINTHKSNFIATRTPVLDDKDYESVGINIQTDSNHNFNIVTPYIPPEEIEQMEKLSKNIENYTSARKPNLVVMGDLNAKSLEWNNDKSNKAGEIIENCMTKTGMLCRNDGQPTRRNTKSVIDLVLITPGINNKVKECTTLAHEDVRSDHICVLLEVDVCKTQTTTKEKKQVWQLNKVDWNNWKEQSEKNMSEWLTNSSSSNDVDEVYQSLKETIDRTMTEVIKKRRLRKNKYKASMVGT
ncbi:GABRA [Mytilus edulis]|uniref:GABRA n=1 Tax=Mytilus edulis TaxID=6550 RepID=A0A8S3RYR4_MYTED|nr:GABRA [Mytilus edulis]